MTLFRGPPAETEVGLGALTMGGLLTEVAARYPEREAVCFHEPGDDTVVRWSYSELGARARRFAKALTASGVGKGTRVALLMGNRPEWVEAAFGVALAGGVLVPVNTLFEAPEIEHVLGHSDTAVLVYQERLAHHRYHEQVRAMLPGLSYLTTLACLGTGSYDDFLAGGDDVSDEVSDGRAAEVSPFDDALVIYTSGSTGRPKGVLHAQRAAAIQSWRFTRHLCLDPTRRVWSAYPFFWTAGYCMVMGATLAAGACLVLQDLFEPGEALALLESERVTTPYAWPHQLAALESHPDWARRDLSAVTQVDSFASFSRHRSVTVDDSWSARAAYGLTETFTIISSMPADTPPERREGHEGIHMTSRATRGRIPR